MTDDFEQHRDEDAILTARWLAHLEADTSPDRLRAYEEVRRLQSRAEVMDMTRAPLYIPHPRLNEYLDAVSRKGCSAPDWDGALVVVDKDGDHWDRRDDGAYESRTGVVMRAAHIEAAYGPVKPISFPVDTGEEVTR